ncbi:hypothetical protein BC831DRAFT_500713 [Entophlyctis helioformis]|nr:hypothetical protein BC831DRAFT_500713 [Entophlyctis helioformis]
MATASTSPAASAAPAPAAAAPVPAVPVVPVAGAPADPAALAAAAAAYGQPVPFAAAAAGAAGPAVAAVPGANASLYVGDLDPSVTEAVLFEVFGMAGAVASIRVCRDNITRRSLGYGYVNFMNAADAERALESLNYTPIRGSPIRIMWSNRDPTIRRAGTGNIFIKNLHTSIDHKALHDTFSAFGNILSCKVAMDNDKSLGYGFVHYETMDMAENAIKHVNGMLLNDQQVFVGLHISKKERGVKLEEKRAKYTNIFVKNIDASVDQAAFEELFKPFGPIVSCALMVNEEGKSREFGFVNYETHDDARRAVEEMHEKEIAGKQLYVGRAQKKAEREEDLRIQYEKIREEKINKFQGVNLYVKNLDESIDDEKLRQEFSAYGVITSAKVMLDEKTGVSKGFGFMNGRMIANKPIYVAIAQRKETRRAHLASQIQNRNRMQQQQMMGGMPGGFPGAPIFYPPGALPPQARGFYPPQAQMMNRPRWPAPGQPQPPMGQPGFPPQQPGMVPPPYAGGMPIQGGARPPRQPRPQSGRGQPGAPLPGGPQGAPGAGFPAQQAGAPGGLPPNAARGRGGAAGYKYTANARNALGAQPGMPAAANGAPMPGRPALNAATLAALPADQQKRTLGEALFPLVQSQAPQAAGKVTGMLLEMDNGELLHLLESPEALNGKVSEALAALEEHMRAQAESAPETEA